MYKCEQCDHTCTDKSNLNKHMAKMHRTCSYCEFVTATGTENIAKHIHDNHVNEYYQELADEENKMRNIECEPDSASDVDMSKLSLEERIKT